MLQSMYNYEIVLSIVSDIIIFHGQVALTKLYAYVSYIGHHELPVIQF
jgi:hypothetical protein